MQETTFNELADLALRLSGQHFAPSKAYLMEARLSSISRRESFATLDDLVHCLKARPNQRFEQEVAAALTSKQTSFFKHRELLDQIVNHALPSRLKLSKNGRLRIWCAGVSFGQEAWSLAMLINEQVGSALTNAEISIVGSDLSTDAIERAERGVYGHYEVQKGLSIHRLMTNFTRQNTGEWEINEGLRHSVSFRRHNLLHPAQDLGAFDIILCSNVLNGLSLQAKKDVLATMTTQLLPDAFLFLGPDETAEGITDTVKPSREMRGSFVKRDKSLGVAVA
jgi:chemotaxis protein methyltransferase CheR